MGRYYDPKVTKRLGKKIAHFFSDTFELEGARLRAETRCAGGVWQRLLLAAVIRAACRSREERAELALIVESLRAGGDEKEDEEEKEAVVDGT